MPSLLVRDLDFNFQRQEIFKSLCLEIYDNDFVSIVGPSGCGKSTLLRLLSGLLTPTNGLIQQSSKVQTKMSFVFQEPRLLPWLRLSENICWGSEEKNLQNLYKILKLIKLEGQENKFPSQLSGGMKMRASLGRALMNNPQFLFLDEPFSALDETTKIELGLDVLDISMTRKITTVLVTHSLSEAVLFSNRIYVMTKNGSIARELKIDEPLQNRRNWESSEAYFKKVSELRNLTHGTAIL